jgi:hypothetical protein
MAHWQDRPRDIAAIRKEFRPKYRIAVALQLGFMRMTGARLNAFNVVS